MLGSVLPPPALGSAPYAGDATRAGLQEGTGTSQRDRQRAQGTAAERGTELL